MLHKTGLLVATIYVICGASASGVATSVSQDTPLPFERTLIVNLRQQTERWAAAQAQFARVGIIPERVDAVLGRDLSETELAREATPLCAKFCPLSFIGIHLSHLRAWQRVVDENISVAMVGEDDVVIGSSFRQGVAEAAEDFPAGWDVIYLGCLLCREGGVPFLHQYTLLAAMGWRNHNSRVISKHLWVPPYALGTHAYLLSQHGARKLVATFRGKIHDSVDVALNKLMGEGIVASYALRDLVAFQHNSCGNSSWNSATTPRIMHDFLDTVIIHPESTAAYGLSFPFFQIRGYYTVNSWTWIFGVVGYVFGVVCDNWNVMAAFLSLLFANDVAFYLTSGHVETICTVIVSTLICTIGFVLGRKVQWVVSRCIGRLIYPVGPRQLRGAFSFVATALLTIVVWVLVVLFNGGYWRHMRNSVMH